MTNMHDDNELMHYGVKRRSGRYPWGSGEDPYQHTGDFTSRVTLMKQQGMSEKEIAESMGINTTTLKMRLSIESSNRRALKVARAKSLKEDGLNASEIGRVMGINESSVRSLLNKKSEAKTNELKNTTDFLKEQIEKKGFIDVGSGVELDLNISRTRLDTALSILKDEGYLVENYRQEQATNPGKYTTIKVLGKQGATRKDLYDNKGNIQTISEFTSKDGGETFKPFQYPESISSKRVMARYAEDGGTKQDGVIELRRGVEDLSLGQSHYAQVRIAVDGTHYIKGMAIYSDKMPPGVDIIVNTNKSKGTPLTSDDPKAKQVLKPLKDNKENPFGAVVKPGGQYTYIDKNGKERLGLINKLREEGDWDEYSRKIASQMLGKQDLSLIKRQLKYSLDEKQAEFETIKSMTNPVVKKQQLESFADDCDAAAVHLKAAALPRQTTKVILPVTTLKDNEVYAPTYKDGEHVALIRYPHGGIFEIPELVVNNKHKDAKSILGNAKDAIGINLNVANKLSGADFDGDTVVVIPTNSRVRIKTAPSLKGLKDFDNKLEYPYQEGMKVMSKRDTQTEMGKISNLITDMTIKGATPDELARAVRHSMVVIDAEKHKLNYKQSELDHDIAGLKTKYQGGPNSGASTLLSKAKSTAYVDERKDFFYSKSRIDPVTGEKINIITGRTYTDKNGKVVVAQEKSTKMGETNDAYTLSSGTQKENAYAKYANGLKALGNAARKEWLSTGNLEYSSSANKIYAKEVESLNDKLVTALKNAPRERMAQRIASAKVEAQRQDNPDMTGEEVKKAKAQAINNARAITGANKARVQISDKEWEAIQAGAIHSSKLEAILKNSDTDRVKELAMPKTTKSLSAGQISKIKAMASSGMYSINDIADSLGVSPSTVSKYMN